MNFQKWNIIIEIIGLIVAIITLIVTIIQVVRYQKEKRSETEKDEIERSINNIKRSIYIFIIIFIVSFGTFLTLQFSNTREKEIEITYPSGDSVAWKEIIKGTSENVQEGENIWIVLYPHDTTRYYPQESCAMQVNGEWSCRICIGGEQEKNKKFDILAVLTDENGEKEFNSYIEKSEEIVSWDGIESLPEGAKIYDRITVTRK